MGNIIIIGGGPSGMMAAISAKKHYSNNKVVILEKNKDLGRKLKLTGGGRCNVTANVSNEEVIKNVVKNGKFLYSSLSNFNTNDIISFFNSKGLKLKEEDHKRMFPNTNKSIDIVNVLYNEMIRLGVEVYLETEVIKVDHDFVYTNNLELKYDSLIVATGGITLPATGSTGFGHEVAKSFGHNITNLLPQEVPLVSNDSFIQDKILQGLSFNDINLKVLNSKGKVVRDITHDLLITHFGLSGPSALRASFDCINILEKESNVKVVIDFLPTIKLNELKVEDLKLLPKRLIDYLKDVTSSEEELFNILKSFPVNIYTTRGMKNAFVTNGGINIKEINPKTMKSKINNKISFCGETLDISAYTGGFNITSALSTGYTAGKHALSEE